MAPGIETTGRNPEQLQKIFKDIEGLQLANPELPELKTIARDASALVTGATLAFQRPDGWEKFTGAFDQLKELYARAMTLRAEQLPVAIGKAVGAPPQDIESSLLAEIDRFKENGLLKANIKDLEVMAKGLGVDPAQILSQGNAANNRYYDRSGSGKETKEIVVLTAKVVEDEKLLGELRRDVLPVLPELEPILRRLNAGLQQLKFDPLRTLNFNHLQALNGNMHKMDTRPLRLAVALGGGLLSGVGLAVNLFTGSPVTWPTLAWGGLAAYSIYPDFMAGNGGRERKFIAEFSGDKVKELMKHLNGPAFEELKIAYKNPAKKKLIDQFATSLAPLSEAQIGALTDGQVTPLSKALNALKADGKAQAALRTFALRTFTKGETETLGVLMRPL